MINIKYSPLPQSTSGLYCAFLVNNNPSETMNSMEYELLTEVKKYGFELIQEGQINDEDILSNKIIAKAKKCWQIPNNFPAATKSLKFVILLDLNIIKMSKYQSLLYPELDNSRILHLASAVKRKINNKKIQNISFFMLLNSLDTLNILNIIYNSQSLDEILTAIERKKNIFQSPYHSIKSLNEYGFSGKVELIKYKEKYAVLKLFRPSCRAHFQNELYAYQQLAKNIPEIPPLLESGEHYIIMPYYSSQVAFDFTGFKLLPIPIAKNMIAILEKIYDNGYSLIDSHPKNFVFDDNNQLKIIDFEYLFKYNIKPTSFFDSIDIQGCQDNFNGLMPADKASYKTRWEPYIGLSYYSLINDKPYIQHFKRTIFWLTRRLVIYVARKLYTFYRYCLGYAVAFIRKLSKKSLVISMRP